MTSNEIMLKVLQHGKVTASFSISYLPMIEPIVRACRDANSLGQIAVARADWVRFEAGNIKAVHDEYGRWDVPRFVTLHLDHIPVVEDGATVDYESIIGEAISLGFGSVMVDGSMLPLDENIAVTRKIVRMAHGSGVAVEGELGAVVGYGGMPMSYEELFATRLGFTDVEQARRMVARNPSGLAVRGNWERAWRADGGRARSAKDGGPTRHRSSEANLRCHPDSVGFARRHGHSEVIHRRGGQQRHRQDQHRHGGPPTVRGPLREVG